MQPTPGRCLIQMHSEYPARSWDPPVSPTQPSQPDPRRIPVSALFGWVQRPPGHHALGPLWSASAPAQCPVRWARRRGSHLPRPGQLSASAHLLSPEKTLFFQGKTVPILHSKGRNLLRHQRWSVFKCFLCPLMSHSRQWQSLQGSLSPLSVRRKGHVTPYT